MYGGSYCYVTTRSCVTGTTVLRYKGTTVLRSTLRLSSHELPVDDLMMTVDDGLSFEFTV